MYISIPAEYQEDEAEARWKRQAALEREELRTLRLVLQYERLKFEEDVRSFVCDRKRKQDACTQTASGRLQVERTEGTRLEADGELRRELRRAVEKGEQRERELAELRAELARRSRIQHEQESIMLHSIEGSTVELREAALTVAMARLQERENEFEEFMASAQRRLELEETKLSRRKEQLIVREKRILRDSISN